MAHFLLFTERLAATGLTMMLSPIKKLYVTILTASVHRLKVASNPLKGRKPSVLHGAEPTIVGIYCSSPVEMQRVVPLFSDQEQIEHVDKLGTTRASTASLLGLVIFSIYRSAGRRIS